MLRQHRALVSQTKRGLDEKKLLLVFNELNRGVHSWHQVNPFIPGYRRQILVSPAFDGVVLVLKQDASSIQQFPLLWIVPWPQRKISEVDETGL
jgi:hypothetical protein